MTEYTFYPAIPATTNNPSNDQPLMQTNNQSINSWVSVDHIGFNNSLYPNGEHAQVSFPTTTTQSTPTNPASVLYPYSDANSHPQIQFLNATNALQHVPYSSTGSTVILEGNILKWGSYTQSSTTQTVDFGVAFPTGCLVVIAVGGNTDGRENAVQVGSFTEASFTSISAGTGGLYYYIAIGY
jgi:hypothetical protein